MPEVSLSRTVYWQNQLNLLTDGNAATQVTIDTPSTSDATLGYRIARLGGGCHNWQSIPVNHWGLYMKECDLFALMYQCDKIIPKKIKVSVSHSIPIAKYPGTSTTTQLSFNNTIYSQIYRHVDLDNVATTNIFTSQANFSQFIRSMDGAKINDNTRNNLPTTDLLWKFPWNNNVSITNNAIYDVPTTTASTVTGDTMSPYTANQLAIAYCPEFLLDNENLYLLYPGENQYDYEYDIAESDGVGIDFSATPHNTPSGLQDRRAQYHINSNKAFNGQQMLYNELVPRIRYDAFDLDNSTTIHSKTKGDIYSDQDEGGFNAEGPAKLFIKGNPILDESNNLVSHTFQGIITWTLDFVIIDSERWIPRPLRYTIVQDLKFRGVNSTNAVADRHMFTNTYPRKLQKDYFKKSAPKRNIFIGTSTPNQYNLGMGTSLTASEHSPNEFRRTNVAYTVQPANTYRKTTGPPATAAPPTTLNLESHYSDSSSKMITETDVTMSGSSSPITSFTIV